MTTCLRCGAIVKNLAFHEPEVCQARIDAITVRSHDVPRETPEPRVECDGQIGLFDEDPAR